MNAKTIILTATALVIGLAARAQEPETARPDSLGTVQKLKEATVVARQELIKTDADKITYLVEKDFVASSGMLIDAMRRIPMVSISPDQRILLNGSSNYKVLVNGRPTGLLARNFNELIKSFPAASVKEIQVMTNPPVKYDAEGIGGIINIVTVKRVNAGYCGSMGASAAHVGHFGGNSFLSAQLGKWTLSTSASGSYNGGRPTIHGESLVENFTSERLRENLLAFSNKQKQGLGSFAMEASCEIDSLNLLTLSGWANLQRAHRIYEATETFRNASGQVSRQYDEPMERFDRSKTFSGELAYQHTFKGDGGLLTFSYAIDGDPSTTDNHVAVSPILDCQPYLRHSFNTEQTLQQMAQADWFATLRKKHQLESGVKYTFRSHVADSHDEVWDYAGSRWVADDSNLNDLDYSQHIFAAYASYGYRFNKLTLKAGTRLEYTLNRGVSKSAAADITFDNSNFNIVPYLNASWQTGSRSALSLTYTRRLGRPGVSYLNPYIYEETPTSHIHGNPDLRTVVSDALTISWRHGGEKWDVTTRLYGSHSGNKIEYLSIIHPDGVKEGTYGNVSRYNHAEALINLNWSPALRTTFSLATRGGYDSYYAKVLEQRNGGWFYSVNLGFDIGLWREASLNGSLQGYSQPVTLQRSYSGFDYDYTFGLQQRLADGRLTLQLLAMMPFQRRYNGSVRNTYAENYHMQMVSWYDPRYFSLSASWRFGKTEIRLRKARKNVVNDQL